MDVVIPEFILLHAIKAGLKFIELDFNTQLQAGTPDNSYLYRIMDVAQIERYNYLEQSKTILFKDSDDPRKLTIDLMYNMDFSKIPSMYITLPGEQHGQNTLGVEQNSVPLYNVNVNDEVTSYNNVFNRRKNATYGIYIISDNSNETALLYYIIDCLLISMTPHLALKGLYNITQGGQDLQLDGDKIPKHLFIKAISIGLQYNRSAPDLYQIPMFTEMMFEGRPTGLATDPSDTPNNLDDI